MQCLACDFGGSSVKYALVDDQAQMEDFGKLPAPLDSKAQFIDTVGRLYDRYREKIEGIAISLPGYIDPDTGYLFESGAYKPLYNTSIINLLKDRCPVPIAVENDGRCAALAEAWKGSLSGCRDGAVIILGSAIAGGIIKDGRIHSGRDFTADPKEHGDLGCAYMSGAVYGLTYRICKAKNLDLSVQDSAPILQWLDSKIGKPYADPGGELKKIKADGIKMFEWLSEGDPDVEQIYRNFITSLAVVVHSIQICFAPEKIAIGGGLSLQSRIFDDLNAELERYYQGIGLGRQLRAEVVKSRYLDESSLIGAMYNYRLHFS